LEIDIYWTPTTNNTTINFLSNHPTEHKIAAYRYITRMQSLPLTTERQHAEWMTIKPIAKSNNFPDKIITNLKVKLQQKINQIPDKEEKKKKKWTFFTYYCPRIRKITNLFKHTNKGIAFRSTNTIQCNTRKLSYIGQTSRNLKRKIPGTYTLH
jgi:hypothetical protein